MPGLDASIMVGAVRVAWVQVSHPTGRREVARRLLRELVSDGTGHPAAAIALRQVCPECGGPHGRIVVTLPDGGVTAVSLSYAASFAFAAVAVGAASVGIDAEADTPHNLAAAREGLRALGLQPGDLTRWTRLEAVAKALGTGLRADYGNLGFIDDDRGWRATGIPGGADVMGHDVRLDLTPTPVLLSVAQQGTHG